MAEVREHGEDRAPRPARRRRAGLVVCGLLAAVVAGLVVVTSRPGNPIGSVVLLHLAPGLLPGHLMVRMRDRHGGDEVLLVGTTHERHLDDGSWSLPVLGSIVRDSGGARILVEMLPADLAAGRLGDAPIEMGYLVLVARTYGLEVRGVDAPSDAGWRPRQDVMFALARKAMAGARRSVLFSGFMHLRSFIRQFEEQGFEVVERSSSADITPAQTRVDGIADARAVSVAWRTELVEAIVRRRERARAPGVPERELRSSTADDDVFVAARQRAVAWLDRLVPLAGHDGPGGGAVPLSPARAGLP